MKVDGGIGFDLGGAVRNAQEAEAAGYDGAYTVEPGSTWVGERAIAA